MSNHGFRLACAVVLAVALSGVVSAQEDSPATTPTISTTTFHAHHAHHVPEEEHLHHTDHLHHGHHKTKHHTLVEDAGDGLENNMLQRARRSLKDKLNLLGLAGQLYSEQKEDQNQAGQKISMLLADSVAPEPSKENTTTSTSTTASTATSGSSGSSGGSAAGGGDSGSSAAAGSDDTTESSITATSSTTPAVYKATARELMAVLRKNILGLRNLFQKEWKTAMQDSEKNTAAAIVEFKDSIRPFLRKNETVTKG